jgi:ABC-type sugar transport system substrate-binding protein
MCSPDATRKDLNALMSDHIYKKIELVGSSPNGSSHFALPRSVKGGTDIMTGVTRASRSRLSGGLVVGAALALAMVAAPTAAHAAPKIGLVLKPLDNTYFGAMARGAEAAAKEFGIGLTTVAATSLTDDAGQASQLAALDASGEYGSYIVNPVSPTNLLQPLSSVVKKGQPVMNIDLPIGLDAAAKANVTITSYMGSDNVATGAAAGEYMLTILPKGSTVALIGGLPADPGSLARMKGFSNVVEGKLKIIQTVASNADRLKAQQDAASIIRAHPDIGGFFTVSGDMSLGIQTAIDEAGQRGKIAVIGIDGTVPQLEQVRDGIQSAAVEQFPYLMGYQAVEACIAAVAGKSVPKNVPTPVLVVTKENAKEALDAYPAPPASFHFKDPLRELVKQKD